MEIEDEDQQQPNTIETQQSFPPTVLTEIVAEILVNLPVESLLRCRFVCKLWCSLISDPHFVISHLSLSTLNNNRRLIYNTGPKIKTCHLHDVLSDHSINASETDYPLKHPNKVVWIVGSCNGLLCIAIEEDSLFIWNPSTRKSNRSPYHGRKLLSGGYVLYGFGYEELTGDYKVVEISLFFKDVDKHEMFVKVYSMKSGKWKKIGAFPNGIPLGDSGKFSNRALHWSADLESSWNIVSLDLATENYWEVLQPVYDEGYKELVPGVGINYYK